VVPAHHRKQPSVLDAMLDGAWIADITGALTISAIVQYLDIRQ
jgi:hypothetical protein